MPKFKVHAVHYVLTVTLPNNKYVDIGATRRYTHVIVTYNTKEGYSVKCWCSSLEAAQKQSRRYGLAYILPVVKVKGDLRRKYTFEAGIIYVEALMRLGVVEPDQLWAALPQGLRHWFTVRTNFNQLKSTMNKETQEAVLMSKETKEAVLHIYNTDVDYENRYQAYKALFEKPGLLR